MMALASWVAMISRRSRWLDLVPKRSRSAAGK
jgi:hypothetical protein